MAASRAVAVEAARDMLSMSLFEVWIDYVGLGGSLLPAELQAFLTGGHHIGDHDHDMLVQALNEQFMERGQDHPLAYTDELAEDEV